MSRRNVERLTMTTTTEETVIMQKTRELCDTIVAQPEFQALQRQVAQFMNDEQAKSQYQAVVERGDSRIRNRPIVFDPA